MLPCSLASQPKYRTVAPVRTSGAILMVVCEKQTLPQLQRNMQRNNRIIGKFALKEGDDVTETVLEADVKTKSTFLLPSL